MNADNKHDRLKRQFNQMLATTGDSLIDEQEEILDIFCDIDTHVTVDDIEERLKNDGNDVPRDIIKNTLDMFCKYGIAEKHLFKDEKEYYEHKHLHEHHDHMICVRCGKFFEFMNRGIEDLQRKVSHHYRFHPLWHNLEIYGLCDECYNKSEKTLTLAFVPPGQRVRIINVVGGYGIRKRLADLGLLPNTTLEVINNTGPFIVAVKGSRVALGLGIARKIAVTPIDEKDEEG